MLVEVLRLPWKSVLTKPWNKFHGFQRALNTIVLDSIRNDKIFHLANKRGYTIYSKNMAYKILNRNDPAKI